MAESRFGQSDSWDRRDECFAAEHELLCGANVPPKLSSSLRDRILNFLREFKIGAMVYYPKPKHKSEPDRPWTR